MSEALIVETDIGHDPDDFFAISWLFACGAPIKAIVISPGDPDQVAVARLLCKEVGADIPIGVSNPGREKRSSGSIHHELLRCYGHPMDDKGDGLGVDIVAGVVDRHKVCDLFVIGPVSSVGKFMTQRPDATFRRATMQGGFLPYSLHQPAQPCESFSGKEWMPTFNLNGDRPGGLAFLSGSVGDRRLVGKNVCHSMMFTREEFDRRGSSFRFANPRSFQLFEEAAALYFQRHDSKKFHDPTAAACHLHPEIGTWVRGRTVKRESGWTTQLDPDGDHVLADVDREQLWRHLLGR